ncbi:MAG: hypothetical protein FD166_1892 [Bacteroidetes bacterium]|jgi:hypothetical protein|nr:MAG: hypothetical protein FD166_1892 [Bacteroidota bacterium]
MIIYAISEVMIFFRKNKCGIVFAARDDFKGKND